MWRSVASAAGSRQCGPEGGGSEGGGVEEVDELEFSSPKRLSPSLSPLLFVAVSSSRPGIDFEAVSLVLVRFRARATRNGIREGGLIEERGQTLRLDGDGDGGCGTGAAPLAGPKKRRDDILLGRFSWNVSTDGPEQANQCE